MIGSKRVNGTSISCCIRKCTPSTSALYDSRDDIVVSQQDNAHERQEISPLYWPEHSSDLNVIENV